MDAAAIAAAPEKEKGAIEKTADKAKEGTQEVGDKAGDVKDKTVKGTKTAAKKTKDVTGETTSGLPELDGGPRPADERAPRRGEWGQPCKTARWGQHQTAVLQG